MVSNDSSKMLISFVYATCCAWINKIIHLLKKQQQKCVSLSLDGRSGKRLMLYCAAQLGAEHRRFMEPPGLYENVCAVIGREL